jgi:hypothetical protein
MKRTAFRLAVILFVLAGCRSTDLARFVNDLRDMEPLEFLRHLRALKTGTCTVLGVHGPLVKGKHIPRLLESLDSDEKCASVVCAVWSPHVEIGKPTTVGREAGFLIGSFMTQEYPAPLGSTMSDADKEELRKWWRQYQKRKD